MRRRSYVPGNEPKPGRDQVPAWPPGESSHGPQVETEGELLVSGISTPGKRQLRSRPAFVPLSEYAPAVVSKQPLPGHSQELVDAEQSELSGAGQESRPALTPTWAAVQAALAVWLRRVQASFGKRSGSAAEPQAVEPKPKSRSVADKPSLIPPSAGEPESIGEVYPFETGELLPAWLAPATEPLETSAALPVSSEAESDPAAPASPGRPGAVSEPRQRSITSYLASLIAGLYSSLHPQFLAEWRRKPVALVEHLDQWLVSHRKKRTDSESPSSQLPGAPPPDLDVPVPDKTSPASDGIAALRHWIRAHVASLVRKLGALEQRARSYLRRRARILIPTFLLLMAVFLAGRLPRIRQMLDPNPPIIEVLVAGPVVRDPVGGTLTVPLRIVLDDDDLDSIDQELIEQVQISYGETAEMNDSPLGVTIVDTSGDPLTRVIEVTLPGSLAGRQVMLQAATSRRQDQVRLSFAAPPAFEIRKLGGEASEYYDEQGLLRLEVDGSIKDDDGRYDYEWLVTATDASGHANSYSLIGSRGELLLTLDASQPCSEYTVTLLARGDTGSVSWSQERRACRRP